MRNHLHQHQHCEVCGDRTNRTHPPGPDEVVLCRDCRQVIQQAGDNLAFRARLAGRDEPEVWRTLSRLFVTEAGLMRDRACYEAWVRPQQG